MSIALLLASGGCRWDADVRPDSSAWSYAQPGQVGFNEPLLLSLDSLLKQGRLGGVSALLVLKNDKLVYENYYEFRTRDSLQSIGSIGNAIVSMVVGLAVEDGIFESVEDSIYKYLSGYESYFEADPLKKGIRLRDLLTMRSGLSWNETLESPFSPTNDYYLVGRQDDMVGYLLSKPMESRAGQRFSQNSAAALIILKALQQNLSMPLSEYLDGRFFSPLGIEKWHASVDQTGLLNLVFGASFKPLDLTKIGYLALHKGKWMGRQLIPEEWVTESSGLKYRISNFLDMGYLWWRFSDDSSWADFFTVNSTFYAQSDDEQYLFVMPSLDMVVVLQTGEVNSYGSNIGYYVLSNFLLRSLQPISGN